MELSDAPDFLAAFRERSLSGAARRLGVNPSTMSRRVAELEGRVGPLLERLPEGLYNATDLSSCPGWLHGSTGRRST